MPLAVTLGRRGRGGRTLIKKKLGNQKPEQHGMAQEHRTDQIHEPGQEPGKRSKQKQ